MPINVGGDDSVKWKVDVTKAREAYSDPPPQPSKPPGKNYYHEGVDHTKESDEGPDELYDFTITLEVPTYPNTADGRMAFARELTAAFDAVSKGETSVSLRMPVQDRTHGGPNEDQIRISWARASGANDGGGKSADAVGLGSFERGRRRSDG